MQRRKQVVGARDGVEVAGEMQVDVFHRHDLRVSAARCAALDAEAGPERGLAQRHDRLLADAVEAVSEADCRRRLALAGRRRVDGRDEDQLAVLVALDLVDVVERQLGLGPAVGNKRGGRHADLGGDLGDRLRFCFARNFDIGLHGHRISSREFLLAGPGEPGGGILDCRGWRAKHLRPKIRGSHRKV